MPTKRKAISKKTRFEVFKRDGFKCQYCGAMAPDVLLEIDHIQPVSKDGAHDEMNFVTACKPCNSGKSDRTLSDDSVIKKQQAQLAELQDRREQLDMMLKWRDGLKELQDDQIDVVLAAWRAVVPGWGLNDKGLKEAKAMLKKHGLQRVLDAIDTAADSYVKRDADGKVLKESVETAWQKVGGICALSALPEGERRLYYVRAILNKRLGYVPFNVMEHLKRALDNGVDAEDMVRHAKQCTSWTKFESCLYF